MNAKKYKDIINADPEFKIAARFMTKDMCVEAGKNRCIVKLRDGVVTEIKFEDAFADRWDFAVRASVDAASIRTVPGLPLCVGRGSGSRSRITVRRGSKSGWLKAEKMASRPGSTR